ncbi:uncharacterized protein YALI1_E27774g [Yarrowia lipolytica]|uniref:Uncharacterized protein n=1 Tax=Yarrowia lipolytica TaxID=4952 RepID=A0A1D8NJQ9_YARLL|nr:hypothetical protein YALI1_E27774g [Yarrowia lipolytica]
MSCERRSSVSVVGRRSRLSTSVVVCNYSHWFDWFDWSFNNDAVTRSPIVRVSCCSQCSFWSQGVFLSIVIVLLSISDSPFVTEIARSRVR